LAERWEAKFREARFRRKVMISKKMVPREKTSDFWGSCGESEFEDSLVGELGELELVDEVCVEAVSDEKVVEVPSIGDVGAPDELGPVDLRATVARVVEREFGW
jgi:hypothetical protein